jgi:hypothetical protein
MERHHIGTLEQQHMSVAEFRENRLLGSLACLTDAHFSCPVEEHQRLRSFLVGGLLLVKRIGGEV